MICLANKKIHGLLLLFAEDSGSAEKSRADSRTRESFVFSVPRSDVLTASNYSTLAIAASGYLLKYFTVNAWSMLLCSSHLALSEQQLIRRRSLCAHTFPNHVPISKSVVVIYNRCKSVGHIPRSICETIVEHAQP